MLLSKQGRSSGYKKPPLAQNIASSVFAQWGVPSTTALNLVLATARTSASFDSGVSWISVCALRDALSSQWTSQPHTSD